MGSSTAEALINMDGIKSISKFSWYKKFHISVSDTILIAISSFELA